MGTWAFTLDLPTTVQFAAYILTPETGFTYESSSVFNMNQIHNLIPFQETRYLPRTVKNKQAKINRIHMEFSIHSFEQGR